MHTQRKKRPFTVFLSKVAGSRPKVYSQNIPLRVSSQRGQAQRSSLKRQSAFRSLLVHRLVLKQQAEKFRVRKTTAQASHANYNQLQRWDHVQSLLPSPTCGHQIAR